MTLVTESLPAFPAASTVVRRDVLDGRVRTAAPHRVLRDTGGEPDPGRWRWKDSPEYEQGRRLGLTGDAEHTRERRARERAVALVRAGGGPFAQNVDEWSDPRGWTLPELPPGALTVPG